MLDQVATVLTVYGIETKTFLTAPILITVLLQQYLPFTVLKLTLQYVPYSKANKVATVLTVYGIETFLTHNIFSLLHYSCNSTYRLRY